MADHGDVILRAENISKRFSETVALDGVRFSLKRGEVHALMGENGAGKSTLGKVFSGIHHPDTGEIFLNGGKIVLPTPKSAKENGIFTVFQEFNLVPDLSVAENLFLGNDDYYRHRVLLNKKKMFKDAKALMGLFELGSRIDVRDLVRNISIAQMQIIEILKAVDARSEVIILDEPTAALSANEVAQLFKIIRRLKEERQVAFVIVSHRIEEIFEIGDRVTVLRDGKLIADGVQLAGMTEDQLVASMVGREIRDLYGTRDRAKPKERVVFEINELSDTTGRVKDASIHVRAGEIVGLTGLVGAGRTELARCAIGVDPMQHGSVLVNGRRIESPTIRKMATEGVAYVTEDRKFDGLVLNMAIGKNMSMPQQNLRRQPFLNTRTEKNNSDRMQNDLRIRMASRHDSCDSLSGGNQQKVLLGKWLVTNPSVLIVDEPTRGVDISAKSEIYAILNNLADEGKAILIISSEQQEIIGMCDRTYVMRDGSIAGEVSRDDFSEEAITKLATIGQ